MAKTRPQPEPPEPEPSNRDLGRFTHREFGSILPPRSIEDILAERVRLVIGGQEYLLPALVIADNEAWKAQLDVEMTGLLQAAEDKGDDRGAVLTALAADTSPFFDLLAAYDKTGVLPAREVMRAELTELGLLCAVLEVWRAANPLVDIGIDAWGMTVQQTSVWQQRMARLRRSTGGPSGSSGPN